MGQRLMAYEVTRVQGQEERRGQMLQARMEGEGLVFL